MSPLPAQMDDIDYERQVLVTAIRRLPRRNRDVFVLHRFAAMPVEQIAVHFGMDTKAVEAHLAEALGRLSRAVAAVGDRGATECE